MRPQQHIRPLAFAVAAPRQHGDRVRCEVDRPGQEGLAAVSREHIEAAPLDAIVRTWISRLRRPRQERARRVPASLAGGGGSTASRVGVGVGVGVGVVVLAVVAAASTDGGGSLQPMTTAITAKVTGLIVPSISHDGVVRRRRWFASKQSARRHARLRGSRRWRGASQATRRPRQRRRELARNHARGRPPCEDDRGER